MFIQCVVRQNHYIYSIFSTLLSFLCSQLSVMDKTKLSIIDQSINRLIDGDYYSFFVHFLSLFQSKMSVVSLSLVIFFFVSSFIMKKINFELCVCVCMCFLLKTENFFFVCCTNCCLLMIIVKNGLT